jgi:hypothetical protein
MCYMGYMSRQGPRSLPGRGPLVPKHPYNSAHGQQRYGLRWQSGAATPLSETGRGSQSGVALRFPPHSKC